MPLVISLRSHTREAGFVSGNNPRVIDGAAEINLVRPKRLTSEAATVTSGSVAACTACRAPDGATFISVFNRPNRFFDETKFFTAAGKAGRA